MRDTFSTPEHAAAGIDALWDFDDPAGSEAAFRALLAAASDGADPDLVAHARTQVARAQTLQRAFEEAGTTLDEVGAMLDTASPLVRLRWLLERGRLLNSSGQPAEARPFFEQAWTQASEGGFDFYAVDAAHMIALVASADDALAWNEQALARARASKDERARGWVASLCNNIGWTHHGAGAFEPALEMFQLALRAREAQGKASDIHVARWCVNRCLRSLGRIEEALAAQQALADDMAGAGADEDGYVSEEIGECLLALGRKDDARRHFSTASRLLGADPWLQEQEAERLARLAALGGGA